MGGGIAVRSVQHTCRTISSEPRRMTSARPLAAAAAAAARTRWSFASGSTMRWGLAAQRWRSACTKRAGVSFTATCSKPAIRALGSRYSSNAENAASIFACELGSTAGSICEIACTRRRSAIAVCCVLCCRERHVCL